MTAQPWGRTGHVTTNPLPGDRGVVYVDVDTEYAGSIRSLGGRYRVSLGEEWINGADQPTFDHAVMWILRHATPTVWRAERPTVWRVWAHPIPADPFGPAGWAWFAAPTDAAPEDVWISDGPDTPHAGNRAWIRTLAIARAVAEHTTNQAVTR